MASQSRPWGWFEVVRRKLLRKYSPTNITIIRTGQSLTHQSAVEHGSGQRQQDAAAIKIQSVFRGHLARRAFRALRSLVKLQALVRGALVRKQARLALHCMHTLARLQVRVRARQLLAHCRPTHRSSIARLR